MTNDDEWVTGIVIQHDLIVFDPLTYELESYLSITKSNHICYIMFEAHSFAVCSFCLNHECFPMNEFQSTLALVDVVLMQTQNFFHEYPQDDLITMTVLSLRSFVLYSSMHCIAV